MSNDGAVTIIGAGLAGAEAAYQAAALDVPVTLFEMRPHRVTGAHDTGLMAELVSDNSFGATRPDRATGILKRELRTAGSLIVQCADAASLEAGSTLAVDASEFARKVTEAIESQGNIQVKREELTQLPNSGSTVIATGPLTSQPLARSVYRLTHQKYLFSYHASAPVIDDGSIDYDVAFFASRHESEGVQHLYCPMTEEQYEAFYNELVNAERCVPGNVDLQEPFADYVLIEVLAQRARDELRFKALSPKRLTVPSTGQQPHAAVQLRAGDREGRTWHVVNCGTSLTPSEQRRVFSTIPALVNIDFVRYGQVSRTVHINAPKLLTPTLQLRTRGDLLCAGWFGGFEGYVEATASGLLAGINAARLLRGQQAIAPPADTMLGGMARRICDADPEDFHPMRVNIGLLPQLEDGYEQMSKKEKKTVRGQRALEALGEFVQQIGLQPGP